MSKRVIVIGGGISGLSAAFKLLELSGGMFHVKILEEKKRLGGVIETNRENGFLREAGPDSFISAKKETVELCRRLGIEDQVMPTNEKFRRSFLYQNGKLQPVPKGFYLMAPSRLSSLWNTPQLSFRGKLRAACDLLIPGRAAEDDESLAGFIRRRMGREVYEKIAQPMMGGIYSGDPEFLSLRATMPQFAEMERKYGSVIRGLLKKNESGESDASGPRYSFFLTLKNGLESLTSSLERALDPVEIHKHSRANALRWKKSGLWSVATDGGELEAEAVLLAVPSYRAAALLEEEASDLAHLLEKIPYESVATITLAFREKDLPAPLEGFGYVAAAREKTKLSACTFSSVKYAGRAPEGFVLLRAFAGGAFYRDVFEMDDQALGAAATEEVSRILKISASPQSVMIRRLPKSMPQYHVGHRDRVARIRKTLCHYPGLFLTGNAYEGIGIPDCIRQAESQAEAIAGFLYAKSTLLQNA